MHSRPSSILVTLAVTLASTSPVLAHGTVVEPVSRVYRVYLSNPANPSFPLAQNAVAIDGTLSYYTWNELSRNIPAAVNAGLPPGFDYSFWCPTGQLASGGRVDPNSSEYPRTYAGLDQVSADWPTTPVTAGETIQVDFLATASHDPSVWDVWMTTPDWGADTALNWAQMEFLARPQPALVSGHYTFDLTIPADRTGHHVLWIAWQRDDPAGEVFFSTSDVWVEPPPGPGAAYCISAPNSVSSAGAQIYATGSGSVAANDLVLHATPLPQNQYGLFFHGAASAQLPFGGGYRCAVGDIVRVLPPGLPDLSGTLHVSLDQTGPGGAGIVPGTTRYFQAWYRDPAGGSSSFNLSNGLAVAFLP